MCGRFNLAGLSWKELWQLISDGSPPEGWDDGRDVQIPQSFNVAPTQPVPVVRLGVDGCDGLSAGMARWGLVPAWFKKPIREWKATTINARIEGVATAPSFRDAYRHGRCIVPMAGYYEWSTLTPSKQAHYVCHGGNLPGILVCGLWTRVSLPDYDGLTCAILTEPAQGDVAAIHDRQPVIVGAEGARDWLAGVPVEALPRQIGASLAMHRVGPAVGSWRATGADLIQPLLVE